jgi:hypothetical protein
MANPTELLQGGAQLIQGAPMIQQTIRPQGVPNDQASQWCERSLCVCVRNTLCITGIGGIITTIGGFYAWKEKEEIATPLISGGIALMSCVTWAGACSLWYLIRDKTNTERANEQFRAIAEERRIQIDALQRAATDRIDQHIERQEQVRIEINERHEAAIEMLQQVNEGHRNNNDRLNIENQALAGIAQINADYLNNIRAQHTPPPHPPQEGV